MLFIAVFLLIWGIPMAVTAFTGSPGAVLFVAGLFVVIIAYRVIVTTGGPYGSIGLLFLPFLLAFHVVGTLCMIALAKYVRRRL